jgi:hypothetical protein
MPKDATETDLNPQKLERMKYEILQAERRNDHTRERSSGEMVELIRKTIMSIADATY